MKRKWSHSLIQYGAALGVGLCISALTAWHQGFAWALPFGLNARYLSDGCFVAAVLLMGIGALAWISCTGFFDIFSYAVKSLLVLFTSLRKPQEQISFYEFKLLKEEKRGTVPRFILYVGLLFLGLSVLFLWIYYGGGR